MMRTVEEMAVTCLKVVSMHSAEKWGAAGAAPVETHFVVPAEYKYGNWMILASPGLRYLHVSASQ
jgi:hypothetical protein